MNFAYMHRSPSIRPAAEVNLPGGGSRGLPAATPAGAG